MGFRPDDPPVHRDPYPAYRALRDDDPVHWSDDVGSWFLFRYDHVEGAIKDSRLSVARTRPATGALEDTLRRFLVFLDPPQHTRIRALVNRAFTPRVAERMRPRIAAIVERLLEPVVPTGRIDFVREFAVPLPATVIAELLGARPEDLDVFKAWSMDFAAAMDGRMAPIDVRERASESAAALSDYFRDRIAERRASPRADLLSDLLAAEEQGRGLDEAELLATCILLLFAGHETTTNLLANGLLALLRQQRPASTVIEDPVGAVEECLRYDSAVQLTARVALENVEIGGRRIRAGDRLHLVIGAANRDPAEFPDPDRFEPARRPNRHLSFGGGIHFCLGAALARLEAQIALPLVLTRLPNLSLAAAELEWQETIVLRGLRSLPLTFG